MNSTICGLHIRNGVAGKHFQDAQATATHCSYLGPFSSYQKYTTTATINALEGFLRTSTVSSTFRTLASGSGASTTMLCSALWHPSRNDAALRRCRVCENVFTHLTLKCGNKEVRFEILTHCETIEKTLQVDCESPLHFGQAWFELAAPKTEASSCFQPI